MAKLRPISRSAANARIASCNANPESFNLSYGDWAACCVEDASGKATCIVCSKSTEQCSEYTEFKEVQELFNLLQLNQGLTLAPIRTPPKPTKPKTKRNPKAKK